MSQPDEGDLRHLTGQVVAGKYALTRYLGAGAFGAVFRAEHRILGRTLRPVAVKLSRRTGMTAADASEILSESFLLAEVMGELGDHSACRHLVQVYDAGLAEDTDGRSYVVTEFVQGGTLADQLRGHRVDASLLMTWAKQICTALAALHQLDPPLVHRDLKPDNVLLGTDRTVRLVDFGLAARMVRLGYVPGVVGTYSYMSPETSLGQSTPASDVYSMGLMLYEGLTGRHPFGHLVPPPELSGYREAKWLRDAKAATVPERPSAHNPTVTRDLDRIVLRCLEFDPGARYRDAAELLDVLSAYLTPGRPAESARAAGLRLHGQGDLGAAIAAFRGGLKACSPRDPESFWLHRELGRALASAGDFDAAAENLATAWELTKDRPILAERRARADLLIETADAYRRAANEYKARMFEHLSRRELGAGR